MEESGVHNGKTGEHLWWAGILTDAEPLIFAGITFPGLFCTVMFSDPASQQYAAASRFPLRSLASGNCGPA